MNKSLKKIVAIEVAYFNQRNFINLKEDFYYIIFNENIESNILIDKESYTLTKNSISFIHDSKELEMKNDYPLKFLRFKKSVYPDLENCRAVSSTGLLFYSGKRVVSVKFDSNELEKVSYFLKNIELELHNVETKIRKGFFRNILKEILDISTNQYLNQNTTFPKEISRLNLIREYQYLVDLNYRTIHSVSGYANLLNRSPKTLANVFKAFYVKTPLEIIAEKLHLEAKKELLYTNLSIKEITFSLGFESIQSFSRFFKQKEGVSPNKFRKSQRLNSYI